MKNSKQFSSLSLKAIFQKIWKEWIIASILFCILKKHKNIQHFYRLSARVKHIQDLVQNMHTGL